MKRIISFIIILISMLPFAQHDPVVYRGSGASGTYIRICQRVDFSDFTLSKDLRFRISYKVSSKDGELIFKRRDYQEINGKEILEQKIIFFSSSVWGDIQPGEYEVEVSIVELENKIRVKTGTSIIVKENGFHDDVFAWSGKDLNLSSKEAYSGETFTFSTDIENNSVMKWRFFISGQNGERYYEMTSSTSTKKGVSRLASTGIDSLYLGEGEFTATFEADFSDRDNPIVNSREFSIEHPPFTIDLSAYTPLKYTLNSTGDYVGALSNFSGYSATIVFPVLLPNKSVAGIIESRYVITDNISALRGSLSYKVFFNYKKEAIKLDILATLNSSDVDLSLINMDIANNPANLMEINKDNFIVSTIGIGPYVRKIHELKRVDPFQIFPYFAINIKYEGGDLISFKGFIPGMYTYLRMILRYDYQGNNKSLYMSNSGITKPILPLFGGFYERTSGDKYLVGLANLQMEKSTSSRIDTFKLLNYLKGSKVE